MAVINRIAGFADEMTDWRQHLHAHPELGFDCHKTAAFVVEKLREFGITQIETGIATSGVVGVIEGQGDGPVIGLRADMDALPILEQTGVDYASENEGVMHACGHDGHTTMLLGAAKYLAETRNFTGRVALIFQPAEEGPGGGRVMVEEGILERFGIGSVFALHTMPGAEAGSLSTTPGPIMAAVGMVQAIQTIVSRNHYALDDLVLSVTQIHTGTADNIIPETAYVNGTIRTFDRAVQQMVWTRLQEIVAGQASSFGVEAELRIEQGYPATVNEAQCTAFATDVAREVVGEANVEAKRNREMGSEDFSYMLEKRPGAYLFLGQGEAAGLHHPGFNFNDAVAPVGASFFARLVERAQPTG